MHCCVLIFLPGCDPSRKVREQMNVRLLHTEKQERKVNDTSFQNLNNN